MKLLKKLLLTNWHYFSHEVIEFGAVNFLTGKNASGKTTIIDALQLLILGDTTGHFFNKSASEKSSRSLKGYLRCEFGDNDDGTPLYLRNGRFSSYIAAEFYDDALNSSFVLGIVFDSYDDGNYDSKFFYYDNTIPENHFIENNIPMDYKLLNLYLLNNYPNTTFFPTNVSYREFIKIKFGNLSNTFFSLFKKAIPFSPISNIETFITEYVCDVENTIDVTTMQENFRNYKKLEIECEDLVKRVEVLKDINDKYNTWKEKQSSVSVKQYIMERSDLYLQNSKEDKINQKIEDYKAEIEETDGILERCVSALNEARGNRDRLVKEKFSSDVYKQKAGFEDKYKQLSEKIDELTGEYNSIKDNLNNYVNNWTNGIDQVLRELGGKFTDDELTKMSNEVKSTLNKLEIAINNNNIDESILSNVYEALSSFQSEIRRYQFNLLPRNDEIKQAINNNKLDIELLNSGKKNYDQRVVNFKNIIEEGLQSKYGYDVHVNFLADLLDIKDESWRLAIETYLGNQRFYLITDSEYVDDAIRIYDKVKRELPLFDYGIIDTEKVVANYKPPFKNALSEELICKSHGVEAYISMHLGTLIKCNKIDNLRDNPRSITKDGMLYQNYVARTLPLSRTTPCIGSGSSKEQIKQKERENNTLEAELFSLNKEVSLLGKLTSLQILNTNEIKNMTKAIEDTKDLARYQKEASTIKETISSMSDNYLEALEKNIAAVESEIKELEDERLELNNEIVKANTQIEHLRNEELPAQKAKVAELKEKINNDFVKSWISEVGEPAFIDILKINSNPETLYSTLKSEIDSIISSIGNQWRYIVDLRTKYNTIYELNYDAHNTKNDDYDKEYEDLGEIKLKEYQFKIGEAKDNALKEFRNDFLSKLKSNFDTVISQIDNLNEALEHAKFGEDSYHFVVDPRKEYLNYYEMINDPLLLKGMDIDAEEFTSKYHDTIEDLFRQITFVDTTLGGDVRSELEKNIEKFTDYRSYLKFDLIVTDRAGKTQRLSRTLLTKSGGETQTPFYISILASFSQAYRLYLNNEKNSSIRLIIFDEAFSKMDSERISQSIKLLRTFGLQAIVSAPQDKIPDIVPFVDKTLCVIRNNTMSTIREFAELNK